MNAAASDTILITENVAIDADCIGERWKPVDEATLARLIAIMAMGQAAYAGHILETLAPAEPAISTAQLRAEAKIKLTVDETGTKPRIGYPQWQRDGSYSKRFRGWQRGRNIRGCCLRRHM